ncbi:hypothetical protein I317_05873 [Kwoniella heveanensis CBS 569]|nr:hypothetical protein I317_05873 [Kwoniella heveanensis CBS 569]
MQEPVVCTGPSLGADQLRRDLSSLSKELTSLTLYLHQSPPICRSSSSSKSQPKDSSPRPPSPSTPSRFTRFLSRHTSLKGRKGGLHGRGGKKAYEQLDEAPLLHIRRESDDSDKTLVDVQPEIEVDRNFRVEQENSTFAGEIHTVVGDQGCLGSTLEAEKLLSFLAPHITEIQRLGARLNSYASSALRSSCSSHQSTQEKDELLDLFKKICERLIDLLKELKTPGNVSADKRCGSDSGFSSDNTPIFRSPFGSIEHNQDYATENNQKEGQQQTQEQDHELEMRDLMISALIRKIQVELRRFPSGTSTAKNTSASTCKLYPQAGVGITTSYNNNHHSLAPPSALTGRVFNPFVVHSTGLLAPPINLPNTTTGSQALCTDTYQADAETKLNLDSGARRGSNPIKISLTPSSDIPCNPSNVQQQQGFSECGCLSTSYRRSGSSGGWAKNLVRLGSYQASLLFSNSPVAVRRLDGAKGGSR